MVENNVRACRKNQRFKISAVGVSKTFMAGNATLVLSPSNVAIPCSYTARLIQVEAKPKTLLSLPDRDCVYFAAVSEGDFTQRKPR